MTTPVLPVRIPADELAHRHSAEWWWFVCHLVTADDGPERRFDAFAVVLRGGSAAVAIQRVCDDTGTLLKGAHAGLFSQLYTPLPSPEAFAFRGQSFLSSLPSVGDPWFIGAPPMVLRGGDGIYDLALGHTDPWASRGAAAIDGDIGSMALSLRTRAGAALLGDRGVMNYGDAPDMAYYCWTNLALTGRVNTAGGARPVRGVGWLERQWGDGDPQGATWKYISIQLDDGRAMVFFRATPNGHPMVRRGARIDAGGSVVSVDPAHIRIDDARRWKHYWIDSVIRAPGIELTVTAFREDNEVDLSVPWVPSFWEGAGRVEGTVDGDAVSGRSFTEIHT